MTVESLAQTDARAPARSRWVVTTIILLSMAAFGAAVFILHDTIRDQGYEDGWVAGRSDLVNELLFATADNGGFDINDAEGNTLSLRTLSSWQDIIAANAESETPSE